MNRLKDEQVEQPYVAKPWTKEEETRLLELRSSGQTFPNMAKHFPHRRWDSVRAHYYGLCRPKHQGSKQSRTPWEPDISQLVEMREKRGMPFKMIAEKLQRDHKSTREAYYRYTDPSARPCVLRDRDFTPEEDANLILLYHKSLPFPEMGKRLGRSSTYTRRRAYHLGLPLRSKPRGRRKEAGNNPET